MSNGMQMEPARVMANERAAITQVRKAVPVDQDTLEEITPVKPRALGWRDYITLGMGALKIRNQINRNMQLKASWKTTVGGAMVAGALLCHDIPSLAIPAKILGVFGALLNGTAAVDTAVLKAALQAAALAALNTANSLVNKPGAPTA